MNLQRKLAGKLLHCSPNKIALDPTKMSEIKEAITRADVRRLLKKGTIRRTPDQGISHGRYRVALAAKRKGRRRGAGSRKGAATARTPRKTAWIQTIRAQRAFLSRLKAGNHLTTPVYHQLYRKAKGGFFRSARHLKLYVEEQGLIKK
ncbi:50S ribosomal protein L19e [Candidatus Woesearchaeota archaeon]|nr:50S ribosomal protein L19e [Candidatus Woesearchaeota archaeon]